MKKPRVATNRVDKGPTVWTGQHLPTFGYHNLVTNMNVRAMPSSIKDNAALGIRVALTAEEKAVAHDASVLASQTASANDYHKSKAEMSSTLESLGGTASEIAECTGKVINAFNQTQVNAMKACFTEKIAAKTAAPVATVTSGAESEPETPGKSLPTISGKTYFGFTPMQIGIAVVLTVGAGYVGYNLYKNYKKK